jgi:hypothetical protein
VNEPPIPIGCHRIYECGWERIGDSDDWRLSCPVVGDDLEATWFSALTTSQTVFSVDGSPCSCDAYLLRLAELRGFEHVEVSEPGRIATMSYSTCTRDG